ncbi:MAG: HyaD/HybD family hydrogenase maturation endopeptidase [Thermodesulfobacteriota bacterium]
MKNIVVLGIGNILLSDEGAGVRVVENLQRRYRLPGNVAAIDGGTMGLDLLPYLEGCDVLFIVDAARIDLQPGGIALRRLDDPLLFFRTRISPHQLGLSDVLAAAALTGDLPPEIHLLGIEPLSLATSLDLSEPVMSAIPAATDLLAHELARRGASCTPA